MKFSPASAIIAVLLVLLAISTYMLLNDTPPQTINEPNTQSADEEAILDNLGDKLNLTITKVASSPVPGLSELHTDKGIFYVSNDGDYFVQGRVFNVQDGIIDETENALKDIRVSGIDQFNQSVIEFPAENEEFVINVFTDATCGYCRKLHNEMQQYNDEGITVRYLAWPRAGINSQVYKDTVSIWCSENPQQAMTDAKAGRQVNRAECENNVAEQFRFGQQIGINATPNIMMPDGTLLPGYRPAKVLAKALREAS